jgi:hypothetical protein
MRVLAMSDLHFGAWTGDSVLARPQARELLAPHLDGVDELVLLGDVFDFLFSSVEQAFAEADPFFELVREKLQGKRVVFLAGNHDHHIAVRELRSLIELKVATGADGEELGALFEERHTSFFRRFLDRRLEGVECEIAYPTYEVGDVLLFHGHYLDAHTGGSLPNRLLTRGSWKIAGGRPMDKLAIEDYESVIVPLTELLFTVAQMPRGQAAQMSFHDGFGRLGRLVNTAHALRRPRRPRSKDGLDEAVPAYAQVVRNLGWDDRFRSFVFAHTHRPLDGVEHYGTRFWNTGSWIYEPELASRDDYARYLRRAWPGTLVVIDTDEAEPRLVRVLEPNERRELRAGVQDQFSARAAAYDRRWNGALA